MVIGRNSYEDYAMSLETKDRSPDEVGCPDCGSETSLNEDGTLCFGCSASDFDNREVSP